MFKLIFISLLLSQNLFAQENSQENLKNFQSQRINCRKEVINHNHFLPYDKSVILGGDRAENLVENPNKMIKNLEEMDKQNLLKKELSISPWSDSYWPIYQGILGQRYNDPNWPFGEWIDAHKYIVEHPAKELIKQKNFEYLSPSEKYDYVMGLEKNNLSKANWDEGEEYQNSYGNVESWMGICHGWSIASMMFPEPKHNVDLKVNQNIISFHPSDVKGLGSLLWAKGQFESRFIGGRCNEKSPKLDELGRPLNQDCLDNNPGAWHMAIVNQIGVFNRSFVMDVNYDYQVWNQPVFSYSYNYINVKSKLSVKSLDEALVDRSLWNEDPRSKVRAPESKYIVGINMNVIYVGENSPSNNEHQDINYSSIEFNYDLELDSNKNIIGGEWLEKSHPDFLWVADIKAFPRNYGDNGINRLDLNNISSDGKRAAEVNARYGLPYGPFVRELFKASVQ
jgi:hypothetical protein